MPAFPPPACDLPAANTPLHSKMRRRISGGSGLITSCSAPGLPVSCSIACRRGVDGDRREYVANSSTVWDVRLYGVPRVVAMLELIQHHGAKIAVAPIWLVAAKPPSDAACFQTGAVSDGSATCATMSRTCAKGGVSAQLA